PAHRRYGERVAASAEAVGKGCHKNVFHLCHSSSCVRQQFDSIAESIRTSFGDQHPNHTKETTGYCSECTRTCSTCIGSLSDGVERTGCQSPGIFIPINEDHTPYIQWKSTNSCDIA